MLADHIPTQFAVASGTSVLMHEHTKSYCVNMGFGSLVTELPTIYHLSDLLFAPGEFDWALFQHKAREHGSYSSTSNAKWNSRQMIVKHMVDAAAQTASSQSWLEYALKYFYGFILPANKREIDVILVKEHNVTASNSKNNPVVTFDKPPMSKTQQQKMIFRDIQHQRNKGRR